MTSVQLVPTQIETRSRPARGEADERSLGVVRIGLLGCGVVGREVARLLLEERSRLERAAGCRLELGPILVRDPTRDRGVCGARFTRSFGEVLDAKPDLVIEALGGVQPAAEFVAEALERGIPVVTANKSLLAHRGAALHDAATRASVPLRHEASVGGATPVLATLRQIGADRVRSITGVVNGSCNAILEWMLLDGLSREEAIQRARGEGLVEPDPTADISGRDSAEKLIVLAQALGFDLTPSDVSCEGIERIERADLLFVQRKRLAIRLIAQFAHAERGISAQVAPRLVPRDSPYGRLAGPRNVFCLDADLAGPLVLEGVGAGPRATASAILGDVISILRGDDAPPAPINAASTCGDSLDPIGPCFVRLSRGTSRLDPTTICRTLAANDVDHGEIAFEEDAVRLLTRAAPRSRVQRAVDQLDPAEGLVISGLEA